MVYSPQRCDTDAQAQRWYSEAELLYSTLVPTLPDMHAALLDMHAAQERLTLLRMSPQPTLVNVAVSQAPAMSLQVKSLSLSLVSLSLVSLSLSFSLSLSLFLIHTQFVHTHTIVYMGAYYGCRFVMTKMTRQCLKSGQCLRQGNACIKAMPASSQCLCPT